MANIIITSFFTKRGIPQLGLTPTIRIWEITSTIETLIIGNPDGTMTEVSSSGSPPSASDGFYKFDFTDGIGYDETKTYVVRSDGGIAIPNGERYQTTQIDSAIELVQIDVTNILDIVDEIRKYNANRTFIDENNFTLTVYEADTVTPFKVFDLKDENGVASIISIFERLPQTGSP